MKFVKTPILLLAVSVLFSSCASVFSKEVRSGVTPTVVTLRSSSSYMKREEYTVVFNRNDGSEVKIPITFHVDGWYIAGNFVIGGLIGWLLIDPITGAMYTIDQKMIHANLSAGTASNSTTPTLQLMSIDEYTGDPSDLKQIKTTE